MGECDLMVYLKLVSIVVAVLASLLDECSAVCYFPTEMQGEYITQTTYNTEGRYTNVNITEDSITTLGVCDRRIGNGNNIVLRMDYDSGSCYKCIHINLVSRNILRIYIAEHSQNFICYTKEEKAIASCPIDGFVDDDDHIPQKEIILYKTLDYNGEEIKRHYCPFDGRYRFMLTIDDGGLDTTGCDTKNSELDNCPSSSALNLRFRQCTFRDYEATLECLGQWKGHDNQNFVAFMNTGNQSFGPKYRCATFVKDPDTNIITVSLNADSSLCSTQNMYDRKEILELYPIKNKSFEHQHHQYQHLPLWMHGDFEFLTIDDKQIIYRDQSSFKTYTMNCIAYYNNTSAIDDMKSVRLLTFSQTQCGEEQYHCVAVHKRSANVVEFQIGSKTIHQSSLNDNGASIDSYLGSLDSICGDQYFEKSHFITQSRLDSTFIEPSPCPIDGNFVGLIPDAEDFCARLWSDCEKNDTMNYQVTICGHDEVFDERRYQCIGQWTENNIIYTYTKRLDIPGYECFLGALASADEIFIKEAGEHCRRDVDPYRYSMQLNKTHDCPNKKTKIETHLSHEYNDRDKVLTSEIDESVASPGEMEYEYFDENHLSVNGNTISTSTESKIQVQVNDNQKFKEKTHNESMHPIHPKLNLSSDIKTNNINSPENSSCSQLGNLILIVTVLGFAQLL